MKVQTSIVIVTWNSEGHLQQCLESIGNQTYQDYEVIIVDNNSRNDVTALIYGTFPHLSVIRNKENLGFCTACNQGIRASRGEFILILNPDVVLEPDCVRELVTFLSNDARYGSVGGKLLLAINGEKSTSIDSTGLFLGRDFRARDRGNLQQDRGQYNRSGGVFAVCGAAVLFRRDALEGAKVGDEYFDEDFFAYYDDLDLGWRMRLFGYENGYTPRAIAYHVRGGSGGGAKFFQKSRALQRITLRNRYLMLVKNLSIADLFCFCPFVLFTEIVLLLYICFRAPSLFGVYAESCRNLKKYLRKRAVVQSLRVCTNKDIRAWIIADHG
ncbi:MAG: glycosyltransferase family 2 protein [Deltaproteobacteria bacterium]|nr:glycosyltransferase family 2 protein [Deltaproteobacteria bacterium]